MENLDSTISYLSTQKMIWSYEARVIGVEQLRNLALKTKCLQKDMSIHYSETYKTNHHHKTTHHYRYHNLIH